MQVVEKQRGFAPDELINPYEIPNFLMYLWHDFLALSSTRQAGMGINPISYQEIEAFARLTNTKYSRLELSVIRKLDQLLLRKDKDGH